MDDESIAVEILGTATSGREKAPGHLGPRPKKLVIVCEPRPGFAYVELKHADGTVERLWVKRTK